MKILAAITLLLWALTVGESIYLDYRHQRDDLLNVYHPSFYYKLDAAMQWFALASSACSVVLCVWVLA